MKVYLKNLGLQGLGLIQTKVNLKFLHKDLVCFLPPKDLGLGLMNIVEDLAVKSVTYMKSTEKLEEKRYAYHF